MDIKQLEAFAEANSIEVSEELVAEIAEQMTSDVLYNKRYEHMIAGRLLTPDEVERTTEEVRGEAYTQVKIRLVLEEVIRREQFEVTEDELQREAKALAERQQMPLEAVKGFLGDDLASLKDDILIRKAIDFICSS